MKACLVSAGVLPNFLIKKLTTYILHQSPSCIAHNTIIGCFSLDHSYLQIEKFEKKKDEKFQHELLLIFPFKNEIQVNIGTPLGKVFTFIRSIFSEKTSFQWH